MRAIARAHKDRNLADFNKALREYKDELTSDPTIRSHLTALYDTLLQQNLLRIVEPYSVVEVQYVAEQVKQERQEIETKYVLLQRPHLLTLHLYRLSQMILDKVLDGVLDQGRGCLILFDKAETDVCCILALNALLTILGHVFCSYRNIAAGWQGGRITVCKGEGLVVLFFLLLTLTDC